MDRVLRAGGYRNTVGWDTCGIFVGKNFGPSRIEDARLNRVGAFMGRGVGEGRGLRFYVKLLCENGEKYMGRVRDIVVDIKFFYI